MLNFKTTYNEATKVWSGFKSPRKYSEDYSVGRAALEAMLKSPTKIGQICYHNDKSYTNKELATLTISVAHHFTELGMKQCDMIGICAANSDYVAPLYFGALLKGLTVSAIGVRYEKEDIQHVFGLTKPKIMFCDDNVYDKVKMALQDLGLNIKIYIIRGHVDGLPNIGEFLTYKSENLEYDFEPLKMGPSQTASIHCSSGSTGVPKGITMSHEDLLSFDDFGLESGERYLNFKGVGVISGLFGIIVGTLKSITRVISDRSFSADDFFEITQKYGVTTLLALPRTMTAALASPNIKSYDLSSIRHYFLGGEATSHDVIKEISKYMPNARFYQIYGMSEARNMIAGGEYGKNTACVGGLTNNLDVKIQSDDGLKLGPNEVGEIFYRTPYKWFGYYGDEKATADTLDAEGWIASGDIGYVDEHCKLHLVDRRKFILTWNGFQYSPSEIEQIIQELPEVSDVCVFGLPDLKFGDMPSAAVVLKPDSKLTEQDVYEHVAKRMTHYTHLKGGVYFLKALPLTATGKVSRKEVKKVCEQMRSQIADNTTSPAVKVNCPENFLLKAPQFGVNVQH